MRTLLTSFFAFLKKRKLPTKEEVVQIAKEPWSLYKWVLVFICILATSFFLSLLINISDKLSKEVPDYGGTLYEGVIGAPRFINPLLSASETDQLLTTLTYSGLVKGSNDGSLIGVLAQNFTASPDGKEYRFTLKDDLKFSDKSPLTSADVFFTFETKKSLALMIDPTNDWAFISIEIPDNKTIILRTSGSRESLEDKLSLGIVPKALWQEIPISSMKDSSLNTSPIGSGPFSVSRFSYKGTVPSEVVLERNHEFAGQKPYIENIRVRIFSNQIELKKALENGSINSTSAQIGSYIDNKIKQDFLITELPANKSVSLFSLISKRGGDSSVALSTIEPSIDRNKIIAIIENGYGRALYSSGNTPASSEDPIGRLIKLGYKQDESGTLTKANIPISISIVIRKEDSLLKAGDLLSQELARYGIAVELKVFDQGIFTEQVRQGGYPFILGTESDIPAGYENLIPLYTKITPHISTKDVHSVTPDLPKTRSDVLRDSEYWYIKTDMVWKLFK